MEFDLGHGYEDSQPPMDDEMRLTFWVFGALDEFRALGLLDLAGDSPLADRAQRKLYRKIRDSGYKPEGISAVAVVLRKYSIEGAKSGILALFQQVIDKGMADGYIRYRKNYAAYRGNQEMLFGELGWPPLYRSDIPAEEARA